MARKKHQAVFLPDWRQQNPYQTKLAEALAGEGYVVSFQNYPEGHFPLLRLAWATPGLGIVHLHWIAPLLVRFMWTKSPLKRAAKLLMLMLELRVCRLLGVQVFWTIHNLVAHESDDTGWERRIRRCLVRHVNGCFVHSQSAASLLEREYETAFRHKTVIVPHASYVGEYPETDPDVVATLRQELRIEKGKFVYLFLGAIRRYKGVEELMAAFSRLPDADARLVIAGAVFSTESPDWLVAEAEQDDRIILRKGFVPDEQISAYVGLADIVVLPFAQTLTSGSALLVMSFAKPLILPEDAKVFDFPGEEGALYFKDGELPAVLSQARSVDLLSMGKRNRAQSEPRTWARMAALTAEAYANT